MKKMNMKYVLIGLGIFLIVALGGVTYIVGDMVYAETVGYIDEDFQNTSLHQVYEEAPGIVERFEGYQSEELMIPSTNGYEIEARYIKAPVESDQHVVLVHGIGMNMWRHFREALMYLESGFNVMIYNQRYTGETGGDNRTFGYYERYDIAAVMAYLRERYPDDAIGAHGFSMGAGTLGMYSGMDEATRDANFLILDCPYDTMTGAIRVGIEDTGVPIPTSYALWAGNLYNKMKSGFDYKEVEPVEAIKESEVPVFIIHGEADSVCTVDMGQAMYDSKVEGYKEIWIAEEVEHVQIFDEDPEVYQKRVMQFIENALMHQ